MSKVVATLRTEERFGLKAERLAADTAYGSEANLNWLVQDKKIAPHIPVIDKSRREDGTFSRDDFTRKDALGIVFQNRAAAAPRFRCTYPMITPTLQPLDRTADFKALGRLTSRRSRLHCLDNSFAQVTRQRFRHPRSPHRRINADRLPQPNRFGNPPDSNPAEFALVLTHRPHLGLPRARQADDQPR
jgi:hypothetical protein